MKILVLGVTGMLGNAVFSVLAKGSGLEVFGSARTDGARRHFDSTVALRIVTGIDVENHDSLARVFTAVRPDVVINCIGLVKQLADAEDPLRAIPINALLPHRLARLCQLSGARLVHISTDCVFSGDKGSYIESDPSDAKDLYGSSKYMGEVTYPHTITLRTSIIGHELLGAHGLVEWFLSQQERCSGFTKAIFSGLPTITLAQIVRDVVIPNKDLSGLYHVAAKPIAKFDLLKMIADVYGKNIDIASDDKLVIDRSLNADKFRVATGYVAPEWPELIKLMHSSK